MHDERWQTASEVVYAAARVVSGWVFLQHGAQKLFGVLGGFGGEPGGTAELVSLMGLAGVIEFFGGVLILLGLGTRVAAFISSGEMAVAYFMAHASRGFLWTVSNRGEVPAILAFLFLYFAIRGGGRYSLDAVIAGMRHKRVTPAPAGTATAVPRSG
ncbi:MAG: DoxX family protein [Gemmatimonadaceae bacterium]